MARPGLFGAALSAISGALRERSGFALIETVMSAALLVVVALGVYAGIDGPSSVAASNQARSVAVALAQQDQDRMHAMRSLDLSNYQATRTATVGGVPYQVTSRAEWVTDSSGTVSCTSSSSQANYLKISSAVTSPSIRAAKPVSLDSIVAPAPAVFGSNQGNLSIQLQDEAANPVVGVPVALTPPGTLSLTTNAAGCAFFGYVDPSGASSISIPTSVVAGSTNVVTKSYAQAASISASFDTVVGSGAPQPAQAQAVTVEDPGLPAPGRRVFTAPSLQSTIVASALFPFTSGYGVYAGSCATDDPTAYSQSPSLVTPGPGAGASVTVREPAINVAVTRAGAPLSGAHVVVKSTASGCTESFTQTTNAQGALASPGFPFGPYSVCADDGARSVSATVQNTSPAGTASVPLAVPITGATGVCA